MTSAPKDALFGNLGLGQVAVREHGRGMALSIASLLDLAGNKGRRDSEYETTRRHWSNAMKPLPLTSGIANRGAARCVV